MLLVSVCVGGEGGGGFRVFCLLLFLSSAVFSVGGSLRRDVFVFAE